MTVNKIQREIITCFLAVRGNLIIQRKKGFSIIIKRLFVKPGKNIYMFMKKSYLVSVDRDIYRPHMQFIFFGVEEILVYNFV